jgi:hypothetical protein
MPQVALMERVTRRIRASSFATGGDGAGAVCALAAAARQRIRQDRIPGTYHAGRQRQKSRPITTRIKRKADWIIRLGLPYSFRKSLPPRRIRRAPPARTPGRRIQTQERPVLPKMTKLFPFLLLAGNAGAAISYAAAGDFRRCLYWAASSVCIAAITF